MSLLDRLFGRKTPPSSQVAKDRLQLVLIHDRFGLSEETLKQMQDDLIAVLSKYVDIDREDMDISLTQGQGQNKLVANVPIRPPRGGRR